MNLFLIYPVWSLFTIFSKTFFKRCARTNAINNMKSNKAPGLDGLTVEFYREFWGKVKFFLIDVLNKSYDEKLLSFSQRTSVLSLLFKKGDPLVLDNYRPSQID
jgi:RNase P/RNase MRP subunit p30